MDWLRIGRLEFYKTDPDWYFEPKSFCGCRLISYLGYGVTLLGKECRETQGPKFFQAGKYEERIERKHP